MHRTHGGNCCAHHYSSTFCRGRGVYRTSMMSAASCSEHSEGLGGQILTSSSPPFLSAIAKTLRRMLGCRADLSPATYLLNISFAAATIFSSPAPPAAPKSKALYCCSTWLSSSEKIQPSSCALGPNRPRRKALSPSRIDSSANVHVCCTVPARLLISLHTMNSV